MTVDVEIATESQKKDPSDKSDGLVIEERLVNQTVELI